MGDVSLGNLVVRLSGDDSNYQKMLQKAESSMLGLGRRLSSAGQQLSVMVTAPLAAFAAVGVKSYAEFDDALTKATSLMGNALPVTKQVREQMEGLAREVSRNGVVSLDQLGGAYVELAKAGWDAQRSMSALSTIADIMTVYQVDQAKAVELLDNSYRKLGVSETMRLVAQAHQLASERSKTFSAETKRLKNELEDLAVDVGKELIPYLKKAMEWVRQGIVWFRSLTKEQKDQVVAVAALVAALGPLLAALGSIVTTATLLVGNAGLVAALTLSAGAVVLLSDALGKTDTGLLKMVEDFRIGGTKISTWFVAAASLSLEVWDNFWMTMELEMKSLSLMIHSFTSGLYEAVIKMIRGISYAIDFLWDKLGGVKFNQQTEDNWNYWTKKLDESLKGSEERYQEYYDTINAMGKDSADREAAYKKTIDETFAKDAAALVIEEEKKTTAASKATEEKKKVDYGAEVPVPTGGTMNLGGYVSKSRIAELEAELRKPKPAGYVPQSGLKIPMIPVPPEDVLKAPSLGPRASTGEFDVTSLRRFSLSRVGSRLPSAKQEVKAEGVEKRLDTLIDLTRGKTIAYLS